MSDYGADIAAGDDLDSRLALQTGRRVLLDALRWRFSTPRGALFYDLDYGLDLRAYVNDAMTPADVVSLRQEIAREALKDARVESAQADVGLTPATHSMTVTLRAVAGVGPFVVVFDVTEAAVRLAGTQ